MKRYILKGDFVAAERRDGDWCFAADVETRIAELEAIIAAKLHQRKCHDCGHVGWYAAGVVPYCLCEKCGSQDTRG